ncbi:ankyrin repeat domain-containing protein [bacterium]|nr:ankyrin repeat domain-containing protein [bacterium]
MKQMPQAGRSSDQLQFGLKPPGISVMTVEKHSALSPEERNALTREETNEVFNRNEWRKWRMEPGNGAKMYEEYLEWLKDTPEEIQTRLNNQILVTCTCDCQSLGVLKRLLSKGVNPNHRVEWCNDGSPTLHQWALYANVEAVQLLLEHGADINILDNLGRSALEYATGALNWTEPSKAEQVVKLIIQAGADVNVKSTLGYTPLIWAARAGNLKITKLLIEKGANVDDTDNDDNNALHYALNPGYKPASTVKRNRQSTIRLLRKHGGKTGEELRAEGR